jgi:hypothetical protein
MSDIFLMAYPFAVARRLRACIVRFCPQVDHLQLDPACMNVPVADAFEPREAFLRRFDRSFRTARRTDDYRALTAVEKLLISGNIIDERHAIGMHLSGSQA